jgi:hypothetical protein
LRSYQSVIRVASGVAALGQRSFVAGLLQVVRLRETPERREWRDG